MTTATVKQGDSVSLTTTETEYTLDGPVGLNGEAIVALTHLSGTSQYGVGRPGAVAPSIGASAETLTTAETKRIVTVSATCKLRLKSTSTGTMSVSW